MRSASLAVMPQVLVAAVFRDEHTLATQIIQTTLRQLHTKSQSHIDLNSGCLPPPFSFFQ